MSALLPVLWNLSGWMDIGRWERGWSNSACLGLRPSWHRVPHTSVALVEASCIIPQQKLSCKGTLKAFREGAIWNPRPVLSPVSPTSSPCFSLTVRRWQRSMAFLTVPAQASLGLPFHMRRGGSSILVSSSGPRVGSAEPGRSNGQSEHRIQGTKTQRPLPKVPR